MSQTFVHQFTVSLDGFGTGEGQTREEPFGHAGERLHQWMFDTHWWKSRGSVSAGGVDDAFLQRHDQGVGAEIMGANKWGFKGWHEDPDWKGWWGDNPPFKHPVFVLTHHPRPALEFENGTSFHFVDGPPEQILEQALAAAGGKDVKVNGGVSTVRAFWKARLLDELHLVMAPVFVGEGERLLGGLGVEEDYEVAGFEASEAAVHYRIVKRQP